MIEFLAFLLPSVLGIKIFMNLNKSKTVFEYIIYYLLHVLFSNFLVIFIFNYISKGTYNISEFLLTNVSQYMFNSILINIVLPIVLTIINKYITFDVEVENEKKVKNKKSTKSK